MRALLIEPNALIAEAIGRQLEAADIEYSVIDAEDAGDVPEGTDAVIVGAVRHQSDCVSEIRKHSAQSVILCLIERRCAQTVAELLYAGADDVMVKPIVHVEVRARIDAARRRAHGHTSNSVREGLMMIHLDGRDPEIDGVRIHLSQREHAILSVLALHRRRVVAKERIYESVYGMSDYDPLDKVIDVYICKLRKKIADATGGAKYIETVYGRGYKFEAPVEHQVGGITVRMPDYAPQPMILNTAVRSIAIGVRAMTVRKAAEG